MRQGDIWLVRLPFSGGREQMGERPAVVIQGEAYGQGSPLVLIVLLTSQLAALRFPASVRVEPSAVNGLTLPSVAMVFQTRALDRSRFVRELGVLEANYVSAILLELRMLTGQERSGQEDAESEALRPGELPPESAEVPHTEDLTR